MTSTPLADVSDRTSWQSLDLAHQHAARCYWDLRECRWECEKPAA